MEVRNIAIMVVVKNGSAPAPLYLLWEISWDNLAEPRGKFQIGRSELMEVRTGIPEQETFVSSFSRPVTEL